MNNDERSFFLLKKNEFCLQLIYLIVARHAGQYEDKFQ